MPGKCTFTNKWITDPNYSQWISKDADPSKAKCVICYKSFDVSNMGEAALKSHIAGKKHKQNLAVVSESSNPGRINTISSYFSSQGSKSSSTLSSESVPSTSKGTSSATDRDMPSYLTPDSVLKAELIWTMKLIDSHNSYNSAKNISSIFGLMFPDSEIASRFTCGEDKSNYLATFGLAPYFTARTKDKIRGADEYVLLFDESLNKSMQMKQLDIHARFFDSGIVTTRYIGSEFMGHATANDLHDRILPVIQDLGTSNLVQLSMDGPNVNWKLFELLCEDVSKEHKKSLLNIGSCGMHIMHNAFRSGCIGCGWEIEETLCSFHRLFKDSPARTEDFEKVTNSTTFPLKFCRHRWLENQSVMARALEVKPKLDQYVQAAERNQVPNPKTKTFEIVRSAIKDPLFEAKGEFFLSIAREIEPFLADYQTVSPMIPFIGTDIVKILKSLMRRFVKDDILAAASTPLRISKLELKDENLKDTSQVDTGFATKQAVTKAKKKVSERVIYQFRNDCRKFLLNVTKKLLEKSPIKYSLVRTAKWMDPEEILKDGASCETALTATLQVLVNSQYVNGRDCDRSENREMMAGEVVDLHSFKRKDMRLDKFYAGVRESKQLKNLWTIMKLLMCSSHGQADVERGFSVNKEVEVENQKERTLVARRIIVDHIRTAGGVMNVGITKEMLSHAKQARQRYRTFLKEEKKKRMDELKGEKRKLLEDEIDSMKKRKVLLEKDACFLHKEADSTAELAEKGGDLSLLAKSNAMRRRAREKDAEAQNAEQLIKIKEGELVD